MSDTFNVNVIAPLMLSRALLPLLKKGADASKNQSQIEPPLIVNISSILGSIESNKGNGGGIYPYRTSKAALNMMTRSLSLDLRKSNIRALAVHPGKKTQ